MSDVLRRLQQLTDRVTSYEIRRRENLKRLKELFVLCALNEKYPTVEELFSFKAMNLMGISLKEENLGEIQKGRYVQVLTIASKKEDSKKSPNVSLGYFGKAELLDPVMKDRLVEFVLRWRFEKSFMNMHHYQQMISHHTAQSEGDHG